jgi:hypothetical protein
LRNTLPLKGRVEREHQGVGHSDSNSETKEWAVLREPVSLLVSLCLGLEPEFGSARHQNALRLWTITPAGELCPVCSFLVHHSHEHTHPRCRHKALVSNDWHMAGKVEIVAGTKASCMYPFFFFILSGTRPSGLPHAVPCSINHEPSIDYPYTHNGPNGCCLGKQSKPGYKLPRCCTPSVSLGPKTSVIHAMLFQQPEMLLKCVTYNRNKSLSMFEITTPASHVRSCFLIPGGELGSPLRREHTAW